MDKETYMRQLAQELSRWMPEAEKQDILRWYEEYFAEAGPEREAEVIGQLDAPAVLARRLAKEGGWTKPRSGTRALRTVGIAVLVLAVALFALARALRPYVQRFGPGNASLGDASLGETQGQISGNGKMEVDSFVRLEGELAIGDLTVRAEGDQFLVEVECSGTVDGASYRVDCRVTDRCLYLESVPLSFPNGSGLRCQADVVITVPEGQPLEALRLSVGMGGIRLDGLTAEEVILETGMGELDVRQTDAQQVELQAGMGELTFQGPPAERMELNSGMGEISITLDCGSGQCGYQLASGMGTVTVDGRSQGTDSHQSLAGADCQLTAQTGMGSVSLTFTGEQAERA